METITVASDTPLCSVALDREITGENGRDVARKWTAMSPRGTRSAVRTARLRLRLVTHTAQGASTVPPDDSKAVAEVTLTSEIVDFAFSQCGEFLAVADAGGILHLFKSDGARALFAYPIVASSATTTDSIRAVVFAARAAVMKPEELGVELAEDLLVLTQAGVLIRLGNLCLNEIERILAREASHNVALRTIMASIQLQQMNVGRLRDGANSILLGRRYPSALFVTVANHEDALSVWRIDTSVRQKEVSIKRQAACCDLVDGTHVTDAQFAIRDRCLAVLSGAGSLTWWDWRGLVLLHEMSTESIHAFTTLESHTDTLEQRSCVVALMDRVRGFDSGSTTIQVVQVEHISRSRLSDVISTLELSAKKTAAIVSLTTHHLATGEQQFLITQVDEDAVTISTIGHHRQNDDGADENETSAADSHTISAGVRCNYELRALDLASLEDTRIFADFEEKLKGWIGSIGHELEDSRMIVESLVDFAKRLRQAQTSPSSLPLGLEQHLPNWLDQIASISYRWTTFTLLLSTVVTSSSNSQSLGSRWREFCKANLLEVMCFYLRRGMMRPASLLWQRHTHQDALRHIDLILDSLPQDLPFSAYQNWLHGDVVPAIVKHVERQANVPSSSVADVISIFASWTVKRIKHFAEKGDIDTALKLCQLLKPKKESSRISSLTEMSLEWVSLRLLTSEASLNECTGGNPMECIERLSQQLDHMKYLETQHAFKISLEVFIQETPVTIAMSMLDRCTSAEMVSTEMNQHIVPYLRHCGREQDPVLADYITETLESTPTTTSTSEQARLIAIIDEILDVEHRTAAAKLFFGSLVPPFSAHVKQFTRRCITWDTRQIDVIQEHVRLMEIQDMLTSYGVARFQVGDARGGSRLVSHVLAQTARESAFADALQLVSAYSHLSVERAALEYFENMLTIESSTIGLLVERVASHRSRLMKSAIKQLKDHYAAAGTAWRIISVLEQTIGLGLNLLEMKEAEEETKSPRQSRPSSSAALGIDFFLRVLEESFEIFISEIEGIEVPTVDEKWGGGEAENCNLLNTKLLNIHDIQRIRRVHSEWGILVSVKTLRNPDRVSERVRNFIQPDAMFSGVRPDLQATKSMNSLPVGKGKKRALGSTNVNEAGGAAKKAKSATASSITIQETDEQQDDRQTKLAFDVHRYATHMGMGGDDYHSLVAQAAAEHGDIIRAVQYSRDLFSRRRSGTAIPTQGNHGNSTVIPCASGLALKNISLSISKYTATHTEEIYNLATQGHGNGRRSLSPIQLARMQAPVYSLELLRYAICVCDTDSFEETFLLLKNAMLSNDILQYTQLGSFCGSKRLEEDNLRIYNQWFREESLCVLPGSQTMNLATHFAIAEHRLLVTHSDSIPIGLTDLSASIVSQDFLASKRFVSFLVENNADLLSLQVLLSMRWIPEDALSVVQSQVIKLISTVFQSRNIDSFLALGLMLTMEQRDAFVAFRRQISRENVAKDFNRFQRLAKIGSDSARAWQQLAFLNQCVELEGNARWWHLLNLLEIECDHKAFQSERRDLNYIRTLVPTLLAKSSYDYYTIQEFTRHYQIEDSFPALVYVEALLTVPEATAKSLEYRDKIVGVLEDIHEQRLVNLLLKTLPKVSGTDYDRLLFMFQLLLEHTSYADKEEVERRIEVLHVLKAYASSDRGPKPSAAIVSDNNSAAPTGSAENVDAGSIRKSVCFHRIMTKPRDVLSEILTTRSFAILSNLDYPLRLESDELLMLLLKNVISKHRTEASKLSTSPLGSSSPLSGSELERLFGILASLKAAESKITAGEWLAEHLPVSTHKLRSLEFAHEAAAMSSSDITTHRRQVSGSVTFVGVEALTRLEDKVLRTKIQLVLAESKVKFFGDSTREANLLKLVSTQPKEVFYEVYRSADAITGASGPNNRAGHDSFSLHKIADRVARVLNLRANELRVDLVRELLVRDAVYSTQHKRQEISRKPDGDSGEVIFSPLEQEQRDARDELLIAKISSIAVFVAQESQRTTDTTDAVALVEYLVTFARDTKPRAGVTFRAKLRAARAVLHLAQSHRSVVIAAVEAKMKLAAFDAVIKELVDYIRHCQHMIVFEENRVPYEIGFVMRAKKEALVRSLLRQHSGQEAWMLQCAANLMLDFDVQASDLWEFVLTAMKQQKMFRSLSRILNCLSQLDFVRSIKGASEIWEATLLSPLMYLKSLCQNSLASSIEVDSVGSSSTDNASSLEFYGISLQSIRCELELMVGMLQKCPFLEQIDVASFVVRLRDIHVGNESSTLARVDLFGYGVRCAMVIPRPSARMQALQRIIQSGAYMQVLAQVCDASVLSDEPLINNAGVNERLFSDHVSEQLAILEAIFKEVLRRDEHEKLLGSPFEHGFLEFLALTGTIDRALAIMLTQKRLEAASTLVELYYESNPERAPPGWSSTESPYGDTSMNGSRWHTLQQYVAASTSNHLATYREMTS